MGRLRAITSLLELQQLMELVLLPRLVLLRLQEQELLLMRHKHRLHIRLIHHMSCKCCRYHMKAGSMMVRSNLALA